MPVRRIEGGGGGGDGNDTAGDPANEGSPKPESSLKEPKLTCQLTKDDIREIARLTGGEIVEFLNASPADLDVLERIMPPEQKTLVVIIYPKRRDVRASFVADRSGNISGITIESNNSTLRPQAGGAVFAQDNKLVEGGSVTFACPLFGEGMTVGDVEVIKISSRSGGQITYNRFYLDIRERQKILREPLGLAINLALSHRQQPVP